MRASLSGMEPRRLTGAMVIGVAAGVATPLFLGLVILWGRHIPQQDLGTDYVIAVIWALILAVLIFLWPLELRERTILLALWGTRCLVTLGAMLWFEGNYPDLDGYGYFGSSIRRDFDLSAVRFGHGTENIIQFSALQNLLMPDSYHAQKVTFSFLGLLAIFFLYRAAARVRGQRDLRILVLLGLFPSVLFWSSLHGKEPVVLLGTALYLLGTVGWYRHRRMRDVLVIALGIGLASFIRIWNAPILLAPLLILVLGGVADRGRRYALAATGLLATVLSVRHLAQALGIGSMADLLVAAELWSQAWAIGGSAQRIEIDFDSPLAVVAFIPAGVLTALFRPLPGEILNPFGLLAGLENLLLVVLLLVAVKRGRWADLRHPLALWALALVLVWAMAYSVVSYQNLGTASRFKLQILPVLAALLVYLCRPRWLRQPEVRAAKEA